MQYIHFLVNAHGFICAVKRLLSEKYFVLNITDQIQYSLRLVYRTLRIWNWNALKSPIQICIPPSAVSHYAIFLKINKHFNKKKTHRL